MERDPKYSEYCCDEFGLANAEDVIEWDTLDEKDSQGFKLSYSYTAPLNLCPWCGKKLEIK